MTAPWRFLPCSGCCVCQPCKDLILPDELTLTFSGAEAGYGTCDSLNTSFVLPKTSTGPEGEACVVFYSLYKVPGIEYGGCWGATGNPCAPCPPAGPSRLNLRMGIYRGLLWSGLHTTVKNASYRSIYVMIGSSNSCSFGTTDAMFHLGETGVSESYDCPAFDELEIPFAWVDPNGISFCRSIDWESVTCKLSA